MMIIPEAAERTERTTGTITRSGISMGSAQAILCSRQRNRSLLWAILADLFSWFQVIYFALTRRDDEERQTCEEQLSWTWFSARASPREEWP